MSDLTLARAKRGDPKAFEELIEPYEKLVFNVARRYMGNTEDAKDVAQDSILKIYKNIGSCKTLDTFKAWVCRITANTALDALRRRKVPIEELDASLASSTGLPEEEALRSEERTRVAKALEALPLDSRSLVILRDVQGFSYEEISTILEMPVGTVSSKLSRARLQLRRLLSPRH
jgi:RNA polymerase sigma-70 factor (ECF subfamily)